MQNVHNVASECIFTTLLTVYIYFVLKVFKVKWGREVMRVVEIETQDRQRRYVVIDDEGMLVEPIVRHG